MLINRVGARYGRLLVVANAGSINGRSRWECACDCGGKKTVRGGELVAGRVQSCGCLFSDMLRKRNTTHGRANTPTYRVWRSMNDRCHLPTADGFATYGARGITVCDEWRESFIAFSDYMGPKPTARHSIERINNDGNYEPGNVRWATSIEQANNRRSNRIIKWNGRSMTIAQWAMHLGFPKYVIGNRLSRGWSIHRALSEPLRPTYAAYAKAKAS